MAKKARKVEQLHVECGACGALNTVDRETGEVATYARSGAPPKDAPPKDPPADKPKGADDPPASGKPDEDDGGFLSGW